VLRDDREAADRALYPDEDGHQRRSFRSESGPIGPTEGLPFTSLGELLHESVEGPPWLVEGRLPRSGFSILAGKPKAGKSTVARCLALAVSRGEPWLGSPTHRGVVLYLGLEEKRAEVQTHFKAMGATEEDPVHVFVAPSPQDGLERLRTSTAELSPALIIIDPLFRFVRIRDANDYAVVTASLEPLMVLARGTAAHVLAVHHMGKGERTGGDSILGSTALFGAVDTALLLRRSEKYRTLSSIQRYGEDLGEITLSLDPDTRIVTAGVPRSDADAASAADAILEWLQSQAEPVEERAIQDAVEGRKADLVRALRVLVAECRVIRTGQGRRGSPFLYAVSGF